MSYELLSTTVDLTMKERTWFNILQLAEMHGWHPLGTEAPEHYDEWNGAYDSNDWQTVTEADAINFAIALERALPILDNRSHAVLMLRPSLASDVERWAERSAKWDALSAQGPLTVKHLVEFFGPLRGLSKEGTVLELVDGELQEVVDNDADADPQNLSSADILWIIELARAGSFQIA